MAVLLTPKASTFVPLFNRFPQDRDKINKAISAGFTADEIEEGFDRKNAAAEQSAGVQGSEAIELPAVDPVTAAVGGGVGAFRTGVAAGLPLVKALINATAAAPLAALTEIPIGVAQEQVTEKAGPVAGFLTALGAGIASGVLETKLLNSAGRAVNRLGRKVSPSFTARPSRKVPPSSAQTASPVSKNAFTIDEVKALQKISAKPGSVATKIPDVGISIGSVNSRVTNQPITKQPINVILEQDASLGMRSNVVDAEKTLAQLPPVPPNTTRLFRGESPTVGFKDVFKKEAFGRMFPPKAKGLPGEFYTDEIKFADFFRSTLGPDAKLIYIDVPTSIAEQKLVDTGQYVIDIDQVTKSVTGASVDKAGGAIVRSPKAAVFLKTLKRKGGAPTKKDVLPELDNEQALKSLAPLLAAKQDMLVEDVEAVLSGLTPLKIKSLLKRELKGIQEQRIGKLKRGRRKEPGIATISEIKTGQTFLEQSMNTRQEVSTGLQEEVDRATKSFKQPLIKANDLIVDAPPQTKTNVLVKKEVKLPSLQTIMDKDGVNAIEAQKIRQEMSRAIKVGSIQSTQLVGAKGGSLKQLAAELSESAHARDFRISYEPSKRVFQLWGQGETQEFSTFAELQSRVLEQGLVKQTPVEKVANGQTLVEKVAEGKALTGTDKQMLKAQRVVVENAFFEGDDLDPDIPENILHVDPLQGRSAGATKAEKVDVELTAKERFDELVKLGFTENELKAAEQGTLIPSTQDKLVTTVLEKAEDVLRSVDVTDEITFGVGIGQLLPAIKNILSKRGSVALGKRSQKEVDSILGQGGLPLSTIKAFEASVKELLSADDVAKALQVTPDKIEKLMLAKGIDETIVNFVKEHVVGKQRTGLSARIFRSDLSNSPKVQAVHNLRIAAEIAYKTDRVAIRERLKAVWEARGVSRTSPINIQVSRLRMGESTNASPKIQALAAELDRLYEDMWNRLGNERLRADHPRYNPRITDFDNIYGTFSKALRGVEWDDLDPEFKGGQIPTEKELRQVQRIFRSNSEWRTLSTVDRKRMKTLFKFENLVDYDQVPQVVKVGLPKRVFNGFLIPRTNAKIPIKMNALENALLYSDVVLRDIHFTPTLKAIDAIWQSIDTRGVPAFISELTESAQIKAQVQAMLKSEPAGDALVNWIGQNVNEMIGYDVLKNGPMQIVSRLTNTFTAVRLMAFSVSVGGANLTQVVVPWMRNGSFLRPLLLGLTDPRTAGQAQQILKGTGDLLQRVDLPANATPKAIAAMKFVDKLADISFFPLHFSEFFVRGFSVLSEMQKGIDDGLDAQTIMNVSGGKASSYIPNVKLSDEVFRIVANTPRNTFIGEAGKSTITRSMFARQMAFLTTFPVNYLKTFDTELTNAIRYSDKWKLVRWIATVGSLWAIPKMFDEGGYDISNQYGPNNVLTQISAPLFRALYNTAVVVGGGAAGLQPITIEDSKVKLKEWAKFNTYEKFKKGQQELKSNAILDAKFNRLLLLGKGDQAIDGNRPIDELAKLNIPFHIRNQFGIKHTAVKERRLLLRNALQLKQENDIKFRNAIIEVLKEPKREQEIKDRLVTNDAPKIAFDESTQRLDFDAFEKRWANAIKSKLRTPFERFEDQVGQKRLTGEQVQEFFNASGASR